MTQQLTFVVYGQPAPQGSKRLIHHHRGGAPRAQALMIDANPKGLAAWRSAVWEAARAAMGEAGWEGDGSAISLSLAFTLRPSQVLARKIAQMPGLTYVVTTAPDVDKLSRSTMDALTTAGLYDDDRRVARLSASKTYAGGLASLAEPGCLIVAQRLGT